MKKAITFLSLSKGMMVFLLVLMSGIILAQAVPEYMYYKFDAAGNQQNYASAPVGTNPSVLTGLTTGSTGQFSTALVGNGLVSTSNNLSTGWATNMPSTGWTISFWINNFPATAATTYYYFGDATGSTFRCFTGGVAPAGGLLLRGTGLTDVPINSVPATATVIHLVYTGTSVRVFFNGVLQGTPVAQAAVNLTGTGPFYVGGYNSSNSFNAGVLMDEFRMYNRALTDAEVASTWNISLPGGGGGTGTLSGTVTNSVTSNPIAGATISVGALNTTSAANGTYTLANVPVGVQTATCSASGYTTQNQSVTIVASTTTTRNFAMVPTGTTTTVIVGTGTVSCNYPYTTYWGGGRTQLLYTAAQLSAGGASPGSISSIGFFVTTADPGIMNQFNIRIGNTTATTISNWVTTGMQVCFTGTYTVPGVGWQMITLQTPFNYDGTNLMVEVCYTNPSYTNYSYVNGTTAPTGQIFTYWMDGITGCSYVGTQYTGYTGLPNLRFIETPISPGTLTGTVTNLVGGAPIQNASVTVNALPAVNTNAAGLYSVPNIQPGTVNVNVTKAGFVPYVGTAVITSGGTTTLNIALAPNPQITGLITDASSGLPINGATVTVGLPGPANPAAAMSIANGTYPATSIPVIGAANIYFDKTGYDQLVVPATLVAGQTLTVNAALLPTAVQPGPFTAAMNNPPWNVATAINLNWVAPQGMYQIIYDDGTQDNFAIWGSANNLNALKFTPLAWPAKLIGGKVNLGTAGNYPANALPLTPFSMFAYKADGAGGVPGTMIDSVVVTPTDFGWANFTFTVPITINSGDFYLVMKQGGILPHAAGIGVDLTNTQLRSYSKFVAGGGPWVPAAGNFMMRAIVQGVGGPMLDNAQASKNLITASAPEGLIYESPVANVTGYEGVADYPAITPTYQVWRLQQGQEGNQALWNSIWTGPTTSTVDNSWPSLPAGAFRWAVKAIYTPPGQRFSAPTFSNVIGRNWVANVNLCVNLTCAANAKAGTVVKLTNNAYPDTVYTKTTDTSGCVHFTNVWKGDYTITATRFTYPITTQTVTVMGDVNLTITMLQTTVAPTGLYVNEQSLRATWNPPRAVIQQLNEDWSSGSFATNQWTTSGGTLWSVTAGFGNPAPSAIFNWTPAVTTYNQFLTSKAMAGVHAPVMQLKYDIYLSNFSTATVETMAVELWNGTAWSVLKSYTNAGGNIPWTSETLDISSVTHNPAFQIRFHAAGDNSYNINNWNIDNIKIVSTDGTSGPNPCVIGYNVYLNNVLMLYTSDTTCLIPPGQVVYNTTYQACVKAVYGSGYSNPNCTTFTAHFLYPARDLTATGIECSTYLTWKKPVTTGDAPQILSITPKQVDAASVSDQAPYAIVTTPGQTDQGDALWDMMFAYPTTTNQETGVVCIGDFVYTCRWAGGPTWFYKYNKLTGVQVETFDIPGLTAVRDFAFDGTNAYATGYTSTIYKLDLPGHAILSNITTTVGGIRHIAYDPVNNGFWCGDWTTMYLVSATTGATIATGPAVVNVYGSAYDNDPAGPFLWLHSQTTSGAGDELQQWKITGTTITQTGVVKNVATLPGFPATGVAGGLETVTNAGKFGLLGCVQNLNWVFAVELRADAGGGGGATPFGLKGYRVYRDNAPIKTIMSPDTLFYYDYNLNPGTYKYDVNALYDLTTYGIATPPAPWGESLMNTAGLQSVTLNCGVPLPFYEPWDQGTTTFNNWTVPAGPTNHWSVNTAIGNPAPTADFTWQPALAPTYSQALISEVINASPWTCAAIWLDFDIKLLDRNMTGKEKITLDVFYNNTWHQKGEYTNNGSTNWVPKHIDISSVKGKSFRFRFVANGVNSADILHWYIDNIHAYGICKAPTTLAGSQSQFTTTLTWHAPDCGPSGNGTITVFIFDDGTWENGWTMNAGNLGWFGNEFPIAPATTGVIQKVSVYFVDNGTGSVQPLSIDFYNTAQVLIGSSATFSAGPVNTWIDVPINDVPFTGKFYAMVKFNMLPAQSYYLASDENGPYAAQDLGWNQSAAGVWVKASTLGANPAVFLERVTALVAGDLKSVELVPGTPMVAGVKSDSKANQANVRGDSHDYTKMGPLKVSESDSSLLAGYNIYRTGDTGIPPFAKLNTAPVTALTYVDVHPTTTPKGSHWCYFVTSLFKNSVDQTVLCEGLSDTICVSFPAVGMNDLTSGQIMIYPNPANEVVNVKSDYTITRIEVINFAGQTVYTSNTDAKITKIDVTGFKVGMYFVKVSTTEGVRSVKITVTH